MPIDFPNESFNKKSNYANNVYASIAFNKLDSSLALKYFI
jgi:hypothetical protein